MSSASATLPSPQAFRGIPRYDEPMRRHTRWRVGGPARMFFATGVALKPEVRILVGSVEAQG